MKKMMKKTTTWIMIVCTIIGFIPVFCSAAAAKETTILPANEPTSAALLTVPQSETEPEPELEELSSGSLFDLLVSLMKAIGVNIRSISVDELLKLPANVMDDVVTYIFSIFRLFGINIDSLYAKLSSLFFLK